MKKSIIFLILVTNVAFAKILGILVGSGLRNINQEVNLYYSSSAKDPATVKFDSKTSPVFFGKIDFPLLPTLEIKYLEYNLKASLINNLNFNFGSIQATSNDPANITLDQNTKELDLDAYYSLPFLPFLASLKVGLGTNIFNINLKATAQFENDTTTDSYDLSALPIFYIFSGLDFEKSKFIFNLRLRFLPKISISGYSIEYLSLSPQIGYKVLSLPTIKFITYFNYDYSKLKITSDDFYFDRKNNNFEIGGYVDLGF